MESEELTPTPPMAIGGVSSMFIDEIGGLGVKSPDAYHSHEVIYIRGLNLKSSNHK
jgi:hypothetical protein